MRQDLIRGHLDGLLLSVLAESPRHGYEIARRLAAVSGGELDVPEGSLYPALHRLERAGSVASAWDQGEGRRRRVYRITPAGRRVVADTRRDWRVFSTAVDRVLGGTA